MKIAVTYENGEIFQHFGHSAQFEIFTVENGAVGGVTGRTREAVEAYITGSLEFDPMVNCSHHEHTCGSHGCGNCHGCH